MRHAIHWFEVPAKDFARAVTFYSTILGEEVAVHEFGGEPHGLFPSSQDGVSGAIVAGESYVPSTDGTMIYLNAEGKIDAVLDRVERAGGMVLLPKTSIGPHGFVGVIGDTEGNKIGLHSATE